jgi:endonuclease YncB( thermonuclease family)
MQILIVLAAAAAAVLQTSTPTVSSARTVRSEPVMVRAVIDGDTIDVTTFGRVRLLGIDAPEIGRGFDTAAPFAREARDRLTQLILHRWVRLEQEGAPIDSYNRHLAYVLSEDGLFVNAVLLREGLARISARLPLARLPELRRAESDAQAFRRGMWGSAPPIPAPGYTARPKASRATTSKRSRSATPSARRRTTRKKKP